MPVAKVVVNLDNAPSYDVRIGPGIIDGIGERMARSLGATAAVLITDSNVGPLYAEQVHNSLKSAGIHTTDITIPAGEESKSLACVSEIWTAMVRAGFDQDCVVVALGGGVVCDVAGFVAANYAFGVPLVLVPTSLAAMANASFCNMAGINVEDCEQAVGAFAQVVYACASTEVLGTLPEVEWERGCDEIASIAFAEGAEFNAWFEEHAEDLNQHVPAVVQDAIVRSVVAQANALAAG